MFPLLEVWLFGSSSNHFDTLQNVKYILTFTIVDEFLLLWILAGFSLKFPSRCKFLVFCPPGTKIMYYFRFEETYSAPICKVQSLFSNLLSEIVRSDPILSKIGFNLSSTIRSNLSSKIGCNFFIQSFI